jgi:hypothetical protein
LIPASAIDATALAAAITTRVGTPVCFFGDWTGNLELRNREYLSLAQPNHGCHIWMGPNIPSQIVRQVISKQLGLSQWDWKELFGWETMTQTLRAWINGRPALCDAQRPHSLFHA